MKLKLELLIEIPYAATQEARDEIRGCIHQADDGFNGFDFERSTTVYIGRVLESKIEWKKDDE